MIVKWESTPAVFISATVLALAAPSGAAEGPKLWGLVKDLVNTESSFLLRVDVDKPDRTYRVGESMTVTAKPEKDCRLYLFYYNAAGEAACLFPNQHQQENFVRGGTVVQIPAPGAGFRFTARPPCGDEVLQVVGADKPLALLRGQDLLQNVATPLQPRDLKGMAVQLAAEDPRCWAEARVQIATRPSGAPPDNVNPPEDELRKRRHAVCIGINEFRDESISRLSVCERDAQAMAVAFRRRCRVGDVVLLTNAQATRAAIEKAIFHDLPRRSRPGDTVFIFYSAHGGRTPDENHDENDGMDEYLVPYDAVSGQTETMILDDVFARWMRELDGRNVAIILDNCFAGGSSKSVKGLGEKPTTSAPLDFIDGEMNRAKDLGQPNTMVLAASQADQPAWEMRGGPQGVLTHFAIQAIEDRSADSNGDGRLSLGEVYRHLKSPVEDYVRTTFDADQNPVLVDNAHDGIIVRSFGSAP